MLLEPLRPFATVVRRRDVTGERSQNASPDPSVRPVITPLRGFPGKIKRSGIGCCDNRTDDRPSLSRRVLPPAVRMARRNDRSRCCAARSKINFNPLPARRPGDPTAAGPEQPDLLTRL